MQHDLEALLASFDADRFLAALGAQPRAIFGLALGMPESTWSEAFPDRERLELGEGWVCLGSEAFPEADGIGFEVAFEVGDGQRIAPGEVSQLTVKLRFRSSQDPGVEAEAFRTRLIDAIASHFGTRVRRGRGFPLPGGELVVGPVLTREPAYASVDLAWSMADAVGTTLIMG
jgi:hypothetical protein